MSDTVGVGRRRQSGAAGLWRSLPAQHRRSATAFDSRLRPLAHVRAGGRICGNRGRFLQGCMKMANANWPPRVALITGAASGLGRELALLLATDGVVVTGIDKAV